MSDKAENPRAFPASTVQPGMTLRDWFAGQAIGAVIRQCASDSGAVSSPATYFAAKAYEIADAMLQERAKG